MCSTLAGINSGRTEIFLPHLDYGNAENVLTSTEIFIDIDNPTEVVM